MAEQFYTILTKIGKAKIANSNALGNKLNLVKFQVGDSGGIYYNPVEDQVGLKNKVWEGNINSITVDKENPNWIILETIIPTDVGGFMIREAGVFDSEGNLVAIGKYPETYKPIISEGSAKDLYIRMILEVSNSSSVTLKVDPTIILATKKDIEILSNDLNNIKEGLKELKDTELKNFETDVLLKPLKDCTGGFVSLEKVKGATYINLSKFKDVTINANRYLSFNTSSAIVGRTITIVNSTSKAFKLDIYENNVWKKQIYISTNVLTTLTLGANEELRNLIGEPADGWNDSNKTDLLKVMILDGTVTIPPSYYFEGMAHVGEKMADGTYRLEILSTTENLLDASLFKGSTDVTNFKNDGNTISYNSIKNHAGTLYVSLSNLANKEVTLSALAKRARFIISNCYWNGTFYNIMDTNTANDDIEKLISGTFTLTKDSGVLINCSTVPGYTSVRNIMMVLGKEVKGYVAYKDNKAEILTKEPLRVWDSIDKNGFITRGSGQIVLNGSENWTIENQAPQKNTVRFGISLVGKDNSNILCDKIKYISGTTYDIDFENIQLSTNYFYVRILKSKLQTQDVVGFKAWLVQNPITVVYQLATPIIENANKTLILDAYPNGNLQINSGLVQAHVEGTYSTNMGERLTGAEGAINSLNTRTSNLEKASLVVAGAVVDLNKNFDTHKNTEVHRKITFGTGDVPTTLAQGEIYFQYEVIK